MSIRPYWKRHPLQARILALAMLLTCPVSVPIFLVIGYWQEIKEGFCDNVATLWNIVMRGAK